MQVMCVIMHNDNLTDVYYRHCPNKQTNKKKKMPVDLCSWRLGRWRWHGGSTTGKVGDAGRSRRLTVQTW